MCFVLSSKFVILEQYISGNVSELKSFTIECSSILHITPGNSGFMQQFIMGGLE